MADLTIDGFDVSTIGVSLLEAKNWRSSPARDWDVRPIPTAPRFHTFADTPSYSPGSLDLTLLVTGANSTEVMSRLDELKSRAGAEEVTLTFGDQSSRQYYARLARFDDSRAVQRQNADFFRIGCSFQFTRPFEWNSTQDTLSTVTAQTDIPLGTAPTRDFTIQLNGSTTGSISAAVITYQNSTGGTEHTLEFSGLSLGATDTLTVDMWDVTVTGTTGNNLISKMVSTGSILPFDLDPNDGTYSGSSWPSIGVDTGDLDVTYRKAWL